MELRGRSAAFTAPQPGCGCRRIPSPRPRRNRLLAPATEPTGHKVSGGEHSEPELYRSGSFSALATSPSTKVRAELYRNVRRGNNAEQRAIFLRPQLSGTRRGGDVVEQNAMRLRFSIPRGGPAEI